METTNEEPIWFARALERRFGVSDRAVAIREAARQAHVAGDYIASWINWTALETPAAVLEMPSRQSETSTDGEANGQVISLAMTRRL